MLDLKNYTVFGIEVFNYTDHRLRISPNDFIFNSLDENSVNLIYEVGKFIYLF